MKVTVNMGVGIGKQTWKLFEAAADQPAQITGQKPNVRRARKSIAQFKLREGMPVGLAVTCTCVGTARWREFLDRTLLSGDAANPRLPGRQPALVRRARVTTRSDFASKS